MENSGESILIVGSNQSSPSTEEVDMYKYPQGGSFVTKHFLSAIYKGILPNFLVSTLSLY